MKRLLVSSFIVTLVLSVVGVTSVFALDFGQQITVFDGAASAGWTTAYTTWWNTTNEDQEVEWGDEIGQAWDLEGFFLNNTTLTMVGGYDFKNGYDGIYSGDIFIDVNGDMAYGKDVTGLNSSKVSGLNWNDGFKSLNNTFGYDYVVDMTFDPKTLASTYNIYQIDQTAVLQSGYYRQNDASGAWRYLSGGTLLGSGTLTYQTGLQDSEVGFVGGNHNALSIDLNFLQAGTDFTVQYTMGCGNDDLIGKGSIAPAAPVGGVPEPGTLFLLGSGLLGVAALARKQRK